jgi:hypothetical protein
MTPDQHLAHLKRLIQQPYTNGWWEYAKGRAEELAMADSAFASLPILLRVERDRIAAEVVASRPPPSGASSVKQTAPRPIVSRETKPARTRSATLKKSTGLPVSC